MGEWAGQNIRLLADTAKVVPTWKCELCVQGQLSSNFNLEDLRCRFLLYGRESSFQSKTAGLKPQIFSNPAAPQHPFSCFILNEALPFHAPTTTKPIRLSLDSAPALVVVDDGWMLLPSLRHRPGRPGPSTPGWQTQVTLTWGGAPAACLVIRTPSFGRSDPSQLSASLR